MRRVKTVFRQAALSAALVASGLLMATVEPALAASPSEWVRSFWPTARDAGVRRALATLHGARVHAVCGIGNPQRFFATLADAGIDVVPHAFPDHHAFTAADLEFDTDTPVVMTEKDAVKCERFAAPNHWYLPVTAELPDAFCARLERALAQPGPAVESGA